MDWFLIPNSKITKVTSINDIQTDGFSLFNEILLFIILLVIGIVCSIVFGLIRLFKCDTIYVNNEKFNAKSYDTDEVDKSDSNFYENKHSGSESNKNQEKSLNPIFPADDNIENENLSNNNQNNYNNNNNNSNEENNEKKDISEILKNDKSNISNHRLINNSEANSNKENKSNVIITNNNNNISNNYMDKSNISNANDKPNQNDFSNLTDLNMENNNKVKIKNKKRFTEIFQPKHKSLNYKSNMSKKNQIYLAKQDYIFTRFTYSSIRNYFFYSYFIRIYQITLVRLVITYSVITKLKSKKSNTNNSFSGAEVFFVNFLFFIWILLLPLVLLTYLRNHQNDLLSRKQIIKFGSLYLSYRGISKDIYAILMQVKFIAVPYACIRYGDVGDFIYYICGYIFAYYICFVTISKPFSKVWKVFNESLSFLILIIFCVSFIIMHLIDEEYKNKLYSYYTYLSLIISLLVIRSFRIFIDTTKRVMEILKMRMPKQRDFLHQAEAEKDIKLNILSAKLKEKVNEIQNKDGKILTENNNDGTNLNVKDEEQKAMKEFEYDENAEYNVENISDDEYDNQERESNVNDHTVNKFSIKNNQDYEEELSKNKKGQNNKNFFKENKSDLNLKEQSNLTTNLNNVNLTNNKILVQNSNPAESKGEFQKQSSIYSSKQNEINSNSVYSSKNSRNRSDQGNSQYNNDKSHEHNNREYNESVSCYSASRNNNDSNYSENNSNSRDNFDNNKDRRSYNNYESSSNYEDYSKDSNSQMSQTASKLSNEKQNLNINYATAKNKARFNKRLTKIKEEASSQFPETSEKIPVYDNSERSNNSRVQLNNKKSYNNELERINENDDVSNDDKSRDKDNSNNNNDKKDDLNRDLNAEKIEVLKKFKVKNNKKKKKF